MSFSALTPSTTSQLLQEQFLYYDINFQIPIRPGNSGEKSHPVESTEIPLLLLLLLIIIIVVTITINIITI